MKILLRQLFLSGGCFRLPRRIVIMVSTEQDNLYHKVPPRRACVIFFIPALPAFIPSGRGFVTITPHAGKMSVLLRYENKGKQPRKTRSSRECAGRQLHARSSFTTMLILIGVAALAGGQTAFGAVTSDSITNATEQAVGGDSADAATNGAGGPRGGTAIPISAMPRWKRVLSYLSRAAGFIIKR